MRLTVLCGLLSFAFTSFAFASAEPFKGAFEIVSRREAAPAESRNPERAFFSLDVDTLQRIWARYASGGFPADYEDLKNERALLIRFNERDLLFFTLEQSAVFIGGTFMGVSNGPDKRLELRSRPDGKFDLAVQEGKRVTFYVISRI